MEIRSDKVISTIKDQVYEVIKENILNEHFKPGERIQELEIAKSLNVSRSPVRSALNELIGEGLLEKIPNKTIRVRKLSKKEIIDTYEFRLLIERYAIEKIISTWDDSLKDTLTQFRKDFLSTAKKGVRDYIKIDATFHEFLVSASGNEVILHAWQKMAVQIIPFRVISLTSHQRFAESIEEHTNMIDGILRQDLDSAFKYCEAHLMLARKSIVDHMYHHEQEGDS